MPFEAARQTEFEAVLRLLTGSNLSVADLESHIDAFTLAKCNEIVVGSVCVLKYVEQFNWPRVADQRVRYFASCTIR